MSCRTLGTSEMGFVRAAGTLRSLDDGHEEFGGPIAQTLIANCNSCAAEHRHSERIISLSASVLSQLQIGAFRTVIFLSLALTFGCRA